MCGIAGVWSTDPITDPEALVARIDRALAHRGPDGHGFTVHDQGRLALVHRRLAIIDPSPAGRQPMSTPDGRFTIIFNGEIYNHHDLRQTLEGRGVRFATRSDTEVLLQLVAHAGPESLAEARGMFAFALWDEAERTVLVARDRFGIKPLYITGHGRLFAFASEMRTLLAAGVCPRDVDPAGVLAFLRWGAIPGPLTWLRGVRAVEPGSWIRWKAGQPETSGRFADVRTLWAPANRPPRTEAELRARTCAALEDSVRAHLVSDVPVGIFLSGGIDSGALVATASAERAGLHTFTVIFDEASHSEETLAREVAERFGTTHRALRVDSRVMLDEWPAILAHMDQPTIDGVNAYLVSGAVAAAGVKAVMSGIGGDELFGGYPSFTRIPRGWRLGVVPRPLRSLGSRLATDRTSWRARKLQHAAQHADSPFELYRAVRGWTMPGELSHIAGPALRDASASASVDEIEAGATQPADDASIHAAVARLESTMYMRHQLLRDADVMSMAHGLELRVPFVDHGLVGTVWPDLGSYPALMRGKRLLVDSVRRPLPAAIVTKAKQGFTLPFERWLDGPLAEFVSDGLAVAASDGWIAPDAPASVMTSWRSRQCHWSRPWGLAVLGHFLHG